MAFWWELLWQDENFQFKVAQRYTELRSNVFSEENINSIIDSSVSFLGEAIERNFSKWPILGNYVWPHIIPKDWPFRKISFNGFA